MNPAQGRNDPLFFAPSDYLVGLIDQCLQQGSDVSIHIEGEGRIILFPAKGIYYSNVNDMAAFCLSPLERYLVNPTPSNVDFGLLGIGRPIKELLWHAAFHASQGRLPEGYSEYHIVQMPYWPNLTRLPLTPNAMHICALLVRHQSGIGLGRRLLKVEATEMNSIVSAATLSRQMVVVSGMKFTKSTAEAEEQELAAHDVQQDTAESTNSRGLLSMLLAKIKGL